MTTQQQILDFYSRPAGMTSAGEFAPLFDALPNDVGALVRIVQGLGVYDVVASDFYGFNIPDERKNEIHIRSIEKMLDRLLAIDDQPLTVARPVNKRLVCRCRNFSLLLLSLLRAKGVPARARCGFGAYFNPGFFEDHWVCEYWNAAEDASGEFSPGAGPLSQWGAERVLGIYQESSDSNAMGRKRIAMVHERADLTDTPRFLVTDAAPLGEWADHRDVEFSLGSRSVSRVQQTRDGLGSGSGAQ